MGGVRYYAYGDKASIDARLLFQQMQTIFPPDLKSEDIVGIINAIIINSPTLLGMIKQYASMIAADIDYSAIAFNNEDKDSKSLIQDRLESILEAEGIDVTSFQIDLFSNLFIYPEVAVTVFPKYEYECECPLCGERISISSPQKYRFTFSLIEHTPRGDKVSPEDLYCDYKCTACQKQVKDVPVKVSLMEISSKKEIAAKCAYTKIWSPYYTKIRYGAMNRTPECFIDINLYLDFYKELQYVNTQFLTYVDLDNADPEFVKAVILHKGSDRIYAPNMEYTQIFTDKVKIAGMACMFSPLMFLTPNLVHTGVLKMGNEADAIIKANPNMLVSPVAGENSKASHMTDARVVKGAVMNAVEESRDGNSLGVGYMPIPVQATSLWADPRRTVWENEIAAEEAKHVGISGVAPAFFASGLGQIIDPLVIVTVERLFSTSLNQFILFTEKLMRVIHLTTSEKFGIPDYINKLPVITLSKVNGTRLDDEFKQLISAGKAPMDRIAKNHNYASVEEMVSGAIEEQYMIDRIKTQIETKYRSLQEADQIKDAATNFVSPQTVASVAAALTPQAEQIVLELKSMDEGSRRSELHRLQTTDILMYALVSVKMNEYNNIVNAQAKRWVAEQNME